MKKLAIAGASLALAAMPVVGVFATPGTFPDVTSGGNGYVDRLSVTINNACTFARKAYAEGGASGMTSHKNGSASADSTAGGTWSQVTVGEEPSQTTYDTLSATFLNGRVNETLGYSQFEVICNNAEGYQVTVGTTSLDGLHTHPEGGTAVTNSIPNNTTYNASVSGWSPILDDTNNTKLTNATGSNVVRNVTAATDSDVIEITYGVGVSPSQQADTYTGTATYTLTQLQAD